MSREVDDRSADMRLVDLQRRRLDLPERPRKWPQTSESLDETFSGAARVELETPQLAEAMVFGSLHVSPSRGLIAGALVTVTLVVENAGGAAAAVRAQLLLSLDAAYRLGTTTLDERTLADAEEQSTALAPAGADLGSIAPGERRRLSLVAKLAPSVEPFRVSARLDAGGAPTLGVPPLEVERSRAVGAFAQAVAERLVPAPQEAEPEPPAYELETEEELVYEAANAALSSAAAPPAAPEPVAPEPVAPEPAPPVFAAPEPPAEPEPASAAGARYLLTATIDAAGIRFLGRVLQDGSALGLLGHFLVANGLMVRHLPKASADTLGLAKFAAEQAGLLNRLMLQARMKRAVSLESFSTPPPTEAIARVERLPGADAAAVPAPAPGSLTLYLALEPSELTFLARSAATEKTPPFVRNRQVTAALLPRAARGPHGEVRRLDALLAAYAKASLAAITRFFVQLRLQPSLLPTAMRDPALEAAAQALLEALRLALAGDEPPA